MTVSRIKQRRIKLPTAGKRELRTQFGALCYRIRKDKVQVLLVTSRQRGRWIVPKGWPQDKATPMEAAAVEAFEEAGVEGKPMGLCLGIYSTVKDLPKTELPCMVALFPIKVKRLRDDYPEKKQRRRKWFSLDKAAGMVDSPELRQIIKAFDPAQLPK